MAAPMHICCRASLLIARGLIQSDCVTDEKERDLQVCNFSLVTSKLTLEKKKSLEQNVRDTHRALPA